MSTQPLINHNEVMALDGLRTNPQAVELLTYGVHVVVSALLVQNGDIDTLNVQIFPAVAEGNKVLEINGTANTLPENE